LSVERSAGGDGSPDPAGSAERSVSQRSSLDAQPGTTIWLTGLSGSGKSTIAELLVERLGALGRPVELLDGDVVRTHLSAGLGFSRQDRDTNVRRVGWVCDLLNRHGVDAVVALISPYRSARDEVRASVPRFLEVHVDCPLDVLVARDPKGLYRRALAGEIANFTGVSDPYEPPLQPEVVCRTDGDESPDASANRILDALASRGWSVQQSVGRP
jgi:adenylylsulfate kinase